MAKYDDREALTILGAYGDEVEPRWVAAEKRVAAEELLDAVAALKLPGLATRRDGDVVWIGFGTNEVRVAHARGGHFLVVTEMNKPREVPLVFNRGAGRFESPNLETVRRVPVPGEPVERRREALAEIAEMVVNVLKGAP